MGLGRGDARGPPDVPGRRRPPGRGPRAALHGQLGQLLPLGPRDVPGAVRPHPPARRRRTLGGHRRAVGRTRLQPPCGRVGLPAVPLRPALPGGPPGGHGDRGLQHRLLRPLGDPPPAPGRVGDRRLRLHAPGSGGKGDRLTRLPLAGHRRHGAADLPDPRRVLHRGRRGGAHPGQGGRAPGPEQRARHPPHGLLRGGGPRWWPHPARHAHGACPVGRARRHGRLR